MFCENCGGTLPPENRKLDTLRSRFCAECNAYYDTQEAAIRKKFEGKRCQDCGQPATAISHQENGDVFFFCQIHLLAFSHERAKKAHSA